MHHRPIQAVADLDARSCPNANHSVRSAMPTAALRAADRILITMAARTPRTEAPAARAPSVADALFRAALRAP